MSAASSSSLWVTPGEVLGSTSDLSAGSGTYVLAGQNSIYAGVVGTKTISQVEGHNKSVVSVSSSRAPSRLPVVGDVVTCRVTKINARFASVDILCVHTYAPQPAEGSAEKDGADGAASASFSSAAAALSAPSTQPVSTYLLEESVGGTIRQRDVRAFDIDSVEIYKSFRPNDLVKAQVLSLGDARSYFLSTARNDLGVILATSAAGATMVPINWEQMQCPVTQQKEYRKVAKIEA